MSAEELTRSRLFEVLDYDLDTGVFRWRVSLSRRTPVGSLAGSRMKHGHRLIGVLSRPYLAHRLAWLWVHGEWPKGHIDHINGDATDNRIGNLRDVTHQVNQQNQRRAHVKSRSGLIGAHWSSDGRWRAFIKIDNKTKGLGSFRTPEEAHEAYLSAKRRLHPGCVI